MTATLPKRLGARHECASAHVAGSGYHHDRGPGAAPRQKCRYCGGRLNTWRGLYGVFIWTGSGRYPYEEALHVYASEPSAQRVADSIPEAVVRFVPDYSLPALEA